jgi:hypothetical protein
MSVLIPTPSPQPSAFDHLALILGALALVGAAVLDSFHPLNGGEWAAILVAAGALGVKGATNLLPPR